MWALLGWHQSRADLEKTDGKKIENGVRDSARLRDAEKAAWKKRRPLKVWVKCVVKGNLLQFPSITFSFDVFESTFRWFDLFLRVLRLRKQVRGIFGFIGSIFSWQTQWGSQLGSQTCSKQRFFPGFLTLVWRWHLAKKKKKKNKQI